MFVQHSVVRAYKQGLRHGQCERGVVNCCFYVSFADNGTIAEARLAYGGLRGAPILAPKAMAAMVGK